MNFELNVFAVPGFRFQVGKPSLSWNLKLETWDSYLLGYSLASPYYASLMESSAPNSSPDIVQSEAHDEDDDNGWHSIQFGRCCGGFRADTGEPARNARRAAGDVDWSKRR